jgi:hypothetical protein
MALASKRYGRWMTKGEKAILGSVRALLNVMAVAAIAGLILPRFEVVRRSCRVNLRNFAAHVSVVEIWAGRLWL